MLLSCEGKLKSGLCEQGRNLEKDHVTVKLLLVDFENIQKIDLSRLDDSYRAIVFVGAKQNPPKAASKPATAKRFQRVDFFQIVGSGKNALDFHIAFHLGRTFETAPKTECFVLSKDKGFDPLLAHLNKSGLACTRIDQFDDLICAPISAEATASVVCARCHKSSTIEHHGGEWCTNCGCFVSPPDPTRLPSNKIGYVVPDRFTDRTSGGISGECGWCNTRGDMTGGIYDDGEWMCGRCISRYAR
jgi:hypothetical protein